MGDQRCYILPPLFISEGRNMSKSETEGLGEPGPEEAQAAPEQLVPRADGQLCGETCTVCHAWHSGGRGLL